MRKHNLLLWCAATDNTYQVKKEETFTPSKPKRVLEGKCLGCKTKLRLYLDGTPIGETFITYIISKKRGGTDDLDNLSILCTKCQEKVKRLDNLKITTFLQAKRQLRFREPLSTIFPSNNYASRF